MSGQMDDVQQWLTKKRQPELRCERRFHSLLDLMLESVRRQTFTNWTVAFVDPDQLARAGFFFLQRSDHVQCAFCKGEVGYWDPGDLPEVEHRKHFPTCPFVTGTATGNVPLSCPADDTGRAYRLLEEYHGFRVSSTRPAIKGSTLGHQPDAPLVDSGQLSHPQFNTETSRKETFVRWPRESGVDPEALVAAGFFYTGLSDWVQCFRCGGGLFAWRPGDDPTGDHSRYYPWCPFIRALTEGDSDARSWDDNTPSPVIIRPVALSSREVDLLLAHPVAKRLLEMGLAVESVKGALKVRLERTGVFCRNVTDALELVFDYEESRRRSASGPVPDLGLSRPTPPRFPEPAEGTSTTHATPTTQQQQQQQQQQQLRREVVELQRRVEQEEGRLACRVCRAEQVAVVLQPCSHLHLCANCARPFDRCPTCNKAVRGTLRPIIG